MHALVVLAHSWLRWAVLAATLALVARAWVGWRRGTPWAPGTERLHSAVVGLFDLQFLLGLLLYLVLSPLPRAFLANVGAGMKDPTLRFFGVEHIFGMVIAVALVHVGRTRSKKAADVRQRHRRTFGFTLAGLVIALVTVPWPFLKHGRPLARGGEGILPARSSTPSAAAATCPPVYRERCVSCHGDGGRGDGPSARSLQPPPRDFRNPRWQEERSDDRIRDVIVRGGAPLGLGPGMPASPDLSPADVDALVTCIRGLR